MNRVTIIKNKTRPPKKINNETTFRRVREQPSIEKASHRKRQGIGPTPGPVLYDFPPVPKLHKRRTELHAKTFSAPLAQPDIIVDAQIDDDGRSLFNLPAAGWRLPPIRVAHASELNLQPPEKHPVMTFGTKAPIKAAGTTLIAPPLYPIKKASQQEQEMGYGISDLNQQDKPCFVRNRQRSLIGFEEKTVVGLDLRTCLQNCLHISTFYCASVNYNEFEKTCTLNGGNLHLNDVQLISSTSDYYENECSPEQKSDGKGRLRQATDHAEFPRALSREQMRR
ncbi:PAN domain protein [Teladorsagia circumcincta]|uniref:PAN domain protein n=1 Tax=Teladorsagia circumcincta TaxID=45464 RepID=A0A2G9UAE0_TELCI|nr:PAN domain protein [Teladorsagia circumcincta]